MKRKIRIRNGRTEDYQFCYRLTKRNMESYFTRHWGGWKKREYCKHYNPRCMWVILDDGKRCGYLSYRMTDGGAHLTNVQLSSKYQNNGIGKKAIRIFEKRIFKGKNKKITLTVFEENPAVRLYKRLGYKIIENKAGTLKMEKISPPKDLLTTPPITAPM